MKQVAGTLKLDLAQFRALESFSAFASDLDETSKKQLSRGERLVEILKQKENSPLTVEQQTLIIFTATKGHLDKISAQKVPQFEKEFLDFVQSRYASLLETIKTQKKMSPDTEKKAEEVIQEFKAVFKEA